MLALSAGIRARHVGKVGHRAAPWHNCPGTLVRTNEGAFAFLPKPLPRDLELSSSLGKILGEARAALAALEEGVVVCIVRSFITLSPPPRGGVRGRPLVHSADYVKAEGGSCTAHEPAAQTLDVLRQRERGFVRHCKWHAVEKFTK